MTRLRNRLVLVAVAAGLLSLAAFAPPARAQRVLGTVVPKLEFDNMPLEECIDYLRDLTEANIHVNWKVLEEAGITPDTPVNLRLRGVSLRKALTLVLAEVSGGEGLTFDVDGGVIEITTRELADQKVYTKVYPVGDLLLEIPDFDDAPNFSLESQNSNNQGGGQGGQGGQGGNGIFDEDSNDEDEEEDVKTKEERAQELVDLIKEVIQPDIWRDNGGPASIRYFNDTLVVTAPRSVHEAIGG